MNSDQTDLGPYCSQYRFSKYIRPNKKIPVFRVTQPYLSLLVKTRFFLDFLEKNVFYAF